MIAPDHRWLIARVEACLEGMPGWRTELDVSSWLALNSQYKLNRDRLAALQGRDNLTQGGKP
jgi:hypothetical protein